MKKIFCLWLALVLFAPVYAMAYESVSFTQPQDLQDFSLQIPEGWMVQPDAKNASRTHFFYDDIKKKDHGIIEATFHASDVPLFQNIDEANALLLARMKKEKIKDYRLVTVADCPAVQWTNTQTLAAVKKTYVHGLYIMGQNSSLDVLFSTRAKDKDLQAAEFEKLLSTVSIAEVPAVPQSVLPRVREIVDGGLSLEETETALMDLFGFPVKPLALTGDYVTIDGVDYPAVILHPGKNTASIFGLNLSMMYTRFDAEGKILEDFFAFNDNIEKWSFQQGLDYAFDIIGRIKSDFSDVTKVSAFSIDESGEPTPLIVTDRESTPEELKHLLEAYEDEELRIGLYFENSDQIMDLWKSREPAGKPKNGDVLYEFRINIMLCNDAEREFFE